LNSSFIHASTKKAIDCGKAYGYWWYGVFGSIETGYFSPSKDRC